MARIRESLHPTFTGVPVQLFFGALLSVWLLLNWIPSGLEGVLMPVWMPSYLAFSAAHTLRTSVLAGLGGGLYFGLVIVFFTYLEAVVLAGVYRFARRTYRTYRGGRASAAA